MCLLLQRKNDDEPETNLKDKDLSIKGTNDNVHGVSFSCLESSTLSEFQSECMHKLQKDALTKKAIEEKCPMESCTDILNNNKHEWKDEIRAHKEGGSFTMKESLKKTFCKFYYYLVILSSMIVKLSILNFHHLRTTSCEA